MNIPVITTFRIIYNRNTCSGQCPLVSSVLSYPLVKIVSLSLLLTGKRYDILLSEWRISDIRQSNTLGFKLHYIHPNPGNFKPMEQLHSGQITDSIGRSIVYWLFYLRFGFFLLHTWMSHGTSWVVISNLLTWKVLSCLIQTVHSTFQLRKIIYSFSCRHKNLVHFHDFLRTDKMFYQTSIFFFVTFVIIFIQEVR